MRRKRRLATSSSQFFVEDLYDSTRVYSSWYQVVCDIVRLYL